MAIRYATLCLGRRRDVVTWEESCEALGFQKACSIVKVVATPADVATFFATEAEWVYLAGHAIDDMMHGEGMKPVITFRSDGIAVQEGPAAPARMIAVGSAGFRMRQVQVLISGGCSVFEDRFKVPVFRALFGNPVILGPWDQSGPAMMNLMLGGGGVKNAFFQRYLSNGGNAVQAWLATAQAIYGGGAPSGYHRRDGQPVSVEENFRAADKEGQEWLVRDRTIIKGRLLR